GPNGYSVLNSLSRGGFRPGAAALTAASSSLRSAERPASENGRRAPTYSSARSAFQSEKTTTSISAESSSVLTNPRQTRISRPVSSARAGSGRLSSTAGRGLASLKRGGDGAARSSRSESARWGAGAASPEAGASRAPSGSPLSSPAK